MCNNFCKECISHNTKKFTDSIFTIEDTESMLFSYAPQKNDILILSGGEPSLYNNLCLLLELIRKHSECKIVMYTNGSGLCAMNVATIVAQQVNRITFSFYGDNIIHDQYAARNGAFTTLQHAIKNIIVARSELQNHCNIELKYVRVINDMPIFPLLKKLSPLDQIESLVLSNMLISENKKTVKRNSGTLNDIKVLKNNSILAKIPLKLVDILPCSLGRNIFKNIIADTPQRTIEQVIFFDGTHKRGKIIRFSAYASFNQKCSSCALRSICGTTATCYGALCYSHDHWCYVEE